MPRIRVTAIQLEDRHFQINLSDRIALIVQTLLRPGKHGRMARAKAAYFGFASNEEALTFAAEVRRRFPNCRMQVRHAKRLSCQWEVKLSHQCIEELAWQILNQSVPVSTKIVRHVQDFQRRQNLQQQAQNRAETIANAPLQRRDTGRTMVKCGGRLVGID
jgi:hypothetical protein